MNKNTQHIGEQEGAYVQQVLELLIRSYSGSLMNKPLEELLFR